MISVVHIAECMSIKHGTQLPNTVTYPRPRGHMWTEKRSHIVALPSMHLAHCLLYDTCLPWPQLHATKGATDGTEHT